MRFRKQMRRVVWFLAALLLSLLMGACGVGSTLCFAQQPAKTFRVQFHTVNGLIVLDGKINGRPALLLLDTGAGPDFATYEAIGSKPQAGIRFERKPKVRAPRPGEHPFCCDAHRIAYWRRKNRTQAKESQALAATA